jgi:hypothetical protein
MDYNVPRPYFLPDIDAMKSTQDNFNFYLTRVYPQLSDDLKNQFKNCYPNMSLTPQPGFTPLSQIPVLMLVALTATGKSTTLEQLAAMKAAGQTQFQDDIPPRRELADFAIIPTAQVVSGEVVSAVNGREERFGYTGKFAQEFDAGGSASVYGWFYYRWDGKTPIISDGIRGPGEIAYVLEHYPAWRILELWVDPVIRLQRLTNRADTFDQVTNLNRDIDLSFLPPDDVEAARRLMEAGEISHKAVITVRAEAQNYGSEPFDARNSTPHYHFLSMKDAPPQEIATQVARFISDVAR